MSSETEAPTPSAAGISLRLPRPKRGMPLEIVGGALPLLVGRRDGHDLDAVTNDAADEEIAVRVERDRPRLLRLPVDFAAGSNGTVALDEQ